MLIKLIVLINKLATEYAQELSFLGVRTSILEGKVNNLEKTKIRGDFYLRGFSYNDKINNDKTKGTFWRTRARINLTEQVDENTTFFTRIGVRNTFGTDAFGHFGVFEKNNNANYQAIDRLAVCYSWTRFNSLHW